MTEVLHRKVRWRAACLHLAGLIWIPICIAIHKPTTSITAQIWYAITGERPSQGAPGLSEWYIPLVSTFFTFPIVSSGLAVISFLLIRKVSGDTHPFVDLASRSTINLLLSINLYCLIFLVLGIMYPITIWFGIPYLLGLLLPLGHISFAICGAISAWKGQVYAPPLTIKFFK